jgi:hypothetical protein
MFFELVKWPAKSQAEATAISASAPMVFELAGFTLPFSAGER